MKTTKILIMVVFLIATNSCKEEMPYFNGEISFYDDFPSTDTLYGKKIEFIDDIQTGSMIVCDSITLFWSPKYKDYWFLACNINTGENIGFLCRKGGGPDEFGLPISAKQFMVDKLWLVDAQTNKMSLLDIPTSIKDNTTIIDTAITMECLKDFSNSFSYAFILDNNLTLLKPQSELLDMGKPDYLPTAYYIYKEQERLKEFKLYNKPLIPSYNNAFPGALISTNDRIKPDKSKIAMSMSSLSQINILDLNTGKLNGFRASKSIDYKDLTAMGRSDIKIYYACIEVDNHYIFGMYSNKPVEDELRYFTNEIHLFDWEGKAVKRLIVEHEFDEMALDAKNKKLYMKNLRDEVYCYDIAYLYN